MKKEEIERINFLAAKSRSSELSNAEKEEQEALRNKYRAEIRNDIEERLKGTYAASEHGKEK